MRRFLYENSLSLAMLGLFLLFLAGQSLAGWYVYNSDQQDHQQPPIPYGAYLLSGHFFEAVFENWESEFLQMSAYVIFTVYLLSCFMLSLVDKYSMRSKPSTADMP
jgi:hypothetical protein